jgi:hypothetical protein
MGIFKPIDATGSFGMIVRPADLGAVPARAHHG